jgi:PEP-CTERM motif
MRLHFNKTRLFLPVGRFVAFCLFVVLSLYVPNQARADFIVSNGDVQMIDLTLPSNPLQPPLLDITRLSLAGGRLYTNQIEGTPFAVGNTIRTVGILSIGTAIDGTQSPAVLPNTTTLNFIFGIEGKIVASGVGTASVLFTIGRTFLVSDVTGNPTLPFDQDHATTWNFGNQFAEYTLLPQQNIIDGATLGISDSGGVTAAANTTNVSSVNTVSQISTQGIFLFREDSTAAQNAGAGFVNPGLGLFTGNAFLRNVDVAPGPPFNNKLFEGIAPFTNQTALDTFVTPTAADLVVLNSIGAASGFTGLFSGAAPPASFNPGPLGAGGDFVGDLTGDLYVGYVAVAAVPEPTSFALIAIGLGSLGFYGRRVRLRSNRQPNCMPS